MDSFSVHTERADGILRITPSGELDIATAPILERELDVARSEHPTAMIVVDLTKLDFIDSTGLRLLLVTQAACAEADRLRVVNGSPAVVRLFDLAGVRDRLPIISSEDDPLAPL
jgi:anti-sigma B factor antagonist